MGNNSSVLLVRKNPGLTSFVSLASVKRLVDPKVGHTGTLDKFAQGLLVVLTGSMTRLNPLFLGLDKKYHAVIKLGLETDTLDPYGTIVKQAPVPDEQSIREAVTNTFIGTMEQEPPVYSAVHVDGKRASDLARQGEEITMAKRQITIHSFTIRSYRNGLLDCDIHVSKGTYIRSIARDLGKTVGSCGSLSFLERTAVGPYLLDEAVLPDDGNALRESMLRTGSLLERLPGCGRFHVPQAYEKQMDNGKYCTSLIKLDEVVSPKWGVVYDDTGKLRYVVDVEEGRIVCQVGGTI